jgi:hypothetical protein
MICEVTLVLGSDVRATECTRQLTRGDNNRTPVVMLRRYENQPLIGEQQRPFNLCVFYFLK